MKQAFVEVRKQHSRGCGSGFGGPDTYVAVQIVPDGVERLKTLNTAVAQRRGIKLIHCGEGYSQRCKTNRSMLGKALEKARIITQTINEGR